MTKQCDVWVLCCVLEAYSTVRWLVVHMEMILYNGLWTKDTLSLPWQRFVLFLAERDGNQDKAQTDFEYSGLSLQQYCQLKAEGPRSKTNGGEDEFDSSNNFHSTHFAFFGFVLGRVSLFVRLRIFRRSQRFTPGRCFLTSGKFYITAILTYPF